MFYYLLPILVLVFAVKRHLHLGGITTLARNSMIGPHTNVIDLPFNNRWRCKKARPTIQQQIALAVFSQYYETALYSRLRSRELTDQAIVLKFQVLRNFYENSQCYSISWQNSFYYFKEGK